MANPTSNFNWQMPTASDLVTDLPADFEVFGQAVDTSLADLKGGTTGQILAKNSNTNMDFVWITNDVGDITAVTAGTGISGGGTSGSVTITNSMATEIAAKGDLIVGTGAATFDNLTAGSNGETLVADSSTTTGLRYQSNFAAGKNAIINGAFNVNQRAFTSTTTSTTYGFDRFQFRFTGGTNTYSAETFTPGAAPVAGYEATNFARIVTTGQSAAGDFCYFLQRIEDVRTFAGQTVTISFWAKASSGTPNVGISFEQSFGGGGSSLVVVNGGVKAITTSWARYSATVAIPSVSGKTIGTSSLLAAGLFTSAGATLSGAGYPAVGIQNTTIDFWGIQVEAGSVATAFQTATGTLQGELAACQRYYYTLVAGTNGTFGTCGYYSSTDVLGTVFYPVQMRTAPTFSAAAGSFYEVVRNSGSNALTALSANYLGQLSANIFAGSAQGASGTAGHAGQYRTTSASANIAFSAEL